MSAPTTCPGCGSPQITASQFTCLSWIQPNGTLYRVPECRLREAHALLRRCAEAFGPENDAGYVLRAEIERVLGDTDVQP